MKSQVFYFFVFFLGLGSLKLAQARKTDFDESHHGLIFGSGTYFLMPDGVDPVPSLGPTGATFAATKSFYMLPIKLGYFKDIDPFTFEIYGLYVISLQSAWTASGTLTGTGSTSFKSYGGGAQLGKVIHKSSKLRTLLVARAEMILEKATLNFSDSSTLSLSSTAYLFGGGLQEELWLGDMWALSLLAGYQYGLSGNWNVSKTATFMGVAHPAGGLLNSSAKAVSSQFGGLLVEASLHLNF